jgi:Rod binding domain-containing protein
MSVLSASGLTSYDSPLTSTNVPVVDAANEPADIRNGNSAAQKAYQEALGFEDILVQQLTQELASTVTSPADSSDSSGSSGSSDSSSNSSGGILGSDPSTSAFASLIPTALTQSIMSGGGIGIADSLARALDPSIGTPQGSSSTTSSAKTRS